MPRETYEEMIARLHAQATARGLKAYRDPVTKTRVCTSEFLLSRGKCCDCDCRHCPFERAVGQEGREAMA